MVFAPCGVDTVPTSRENIFEKGTGSHQAHGLIKLMIINNVSTDFSMGLTFCVYKLYRVVQSEIQQNIFHAVFQLHFR